MKSPIVDILSHHHSYQPEFHDAVKEVYDDIKEFSNNISKEELDSFFTRLIEPDRTLRFKVEWFDDEGNIHVNRGHRVQFNNAFGPYKGGLRFHPSVNESILKFLGFEQIFKNALTGLPMGGAKGGSDFNPKAKSEHEIRRFCESFMKELYKYIGPTRDVPAGDIGVGTREIGYLYGTYLKLTDNYTGVLTGKHPNFGGSCGREEATGHGAVYFMKQALEHHNAELKDQRVLVSGAGNVALFAIEKCLDFGAKVLTVSDSNGCLYFSEGIRESDLEAIKDLKLNKRQRLSEFQSSRARYLEGESSWGLKGIEAHLALPCATQNEVNDTDLENLINSGVKLIAEGANMPLTSQAQEILKKKGIIFLPGKATNAGGVAVSGFERSQNAVYISVGKKEIDQKLQSIMKEIHESCIRSVDRVNGIYPYKLGANLYAFDKVYSATRSLFG